MPEHVSDRGAGVCRPPGSGLRSDRGMVLLEAALAIPLLVAVAISCLGVGRVAVDEIAAVAAARDAALAAARGTPAVEVRAMVQRRLSPAEVEIVAGPDVVTVSVRTITPLIPGTAAAGVRHQAVAVAAPEPGLAP